MLQARSLRGNHLQYCKESGFFAIGLVKYLNTSAFGCPIKRPTRPAPSIMCEMCAAAQEISWGIITKPQMTTPHTPLMLLGCSLRDWWILYGDLELLHQDNFGFFISIMAVFPWACWTCQSSCGFASDFALTCQSSYYSYPFIDSQDHTGPIFPSLQDVYVCILSTFGKPFYPSDKGDEHTKTLAVQKDI